MLPLRDENPLRGTPYVTYGLIALNVLAFLYELSLGRNVDLLFQQLGVIPYEFTHFTDIGPPTLFPWNLLTSMFLHGGWMHLLGNMLYLWIFGDNVELTFGHLRYLLFYLASGLAAALTQILVNWNSPVPMIGASGAISGVLGAYLVFFPGARILTLVVFGFFWDIVAIPAFFLLGFWFILQFFQGLLSLPFSHGGGVAWFAHVGGFVFGWLVARWYRRRLRRRYYDLFF